MGENIGGAAFPTESNQSSPPPQEHIVAAGETLSEIADHYNLHSASIALVNDGIDDANLVHVGQILTIPNQDASPEEIQKELANRKQQQAKAQQTKRTLSAVSKDKGTTDTTSSDDSFFSPLASYRYISQGFSSEHDGIDMVTPVGTPVRAIMDGCIVHRASGQNGGYGNVIIIENREGTFTALYAHLSGFAGYNVNDCFETGATLGFTGNTGHSTGPHLHFEIRKNGHLVNPQKYL